MVRTEMSTSAVLPLAERETLNDEELVARILAGETALFELIMRRHNQRLYRAARAIVRDESEAEDVMQDAYVRAYIHLKQFAGRAKFSTWLTRIAVHEALARLRDRKRYDEPATTFETSEDPMELLASAEGTPEEHLQTRELGDVLEEAIESLPSGFRAVFMLRAVEEMSTSEVAECLDLSEENVKVRLHRARALLKEHLTQKLESNARQTFQFHAVRCDRVVANVLNKISALTHSSAQA
jgi:RNA polymerase sigma-70 factor, ECF subfamily